MPAPHVCTGPLHAQPDLHAGLICIPTICKPGRSARRADLHADPLCMLARSVPSLRALRSDQARRPITGLQADRRPDCKPVEVADRISSPPIHPHAGAANFVSTHSTRPVVLRANAAPPLAIPATAAYSELASHQHPYLHRPPLRSMACCMRSQWPVQVQGRRAARAPATTVRGAIHAADLQHH